MTQPSRGRVVASWFWAFVPLVTIGLGTAPIMIWAAARKRHAVQAVLALVYGVAITTLFLTKNDYGNVGQTVWDVGMPLLWLGGFAHALVIRRWAFEIPSRKRVAPKAWQQTPRPMPPPPLPPLGMRPAPWMSPQAQQQAVLAAAMNERQARDYARQLAASDPQTAYHLQIGRVDIPRRAFPDGGLIDVNNVPAAALAAVTGLPAPMADQIAEVSRKAGGFGSLNELCALTQLPPQTFDHLSDRLYFPRRLPT